MSEVAKASTFVQAVNSVKQTTRIRGAKMIYFEDIQGLGEPVRLVLAATENVWEEQLVKLFSYKDAEDFGKHILPDPLFWLAYKNAHAGTPILPFGTIPVYQDEQMPSGLAQSAAVVAYLARKTGLMGSSPEEEALNLQIVEAVFSGGRRVTGGSPKPNTNQIKPNITMHEPHDLYARVPL